MNKYIFNEWMLMNISSLIFFLLNEENFFFLGKLKLYMKSNKISAVNLFASLKCV